MDGLKWQVLTASANETQALAVAIGEVLAPKTVVALVGDLGAGKTTFAQGMARGMGVPMDVAVVSPTFSLVNIYPILKQNARIIGMAHMDFYRLSNAEDALFSGVDEHIGCKGVISVIEWADRIPELIPTNGVWIHLTNTGNNQRCIDVEGMEKPNALNLGTP